MTTTTVIGVGAEIKKEHCACNHGELASVHSLALYIYTPLTTNQEASGTIYIHAISIRQTVRNNKPLTANSW
jgi:hypothetical protein